MKANQFQPLACETCPYTLERDLSKGAAHDLEWLAASGLDDQPPFMGQP